MIFIRMQAANDSADLDDLRRFTTPEMFATARLEIQERGPAAQNTDVVRVDADVLDVADEAIARSSACASTARSPSRPVPSRWTSTRSGTWSSRTTTAAAGPSPHRAESLTASVA